MNLFLSGDGQLQQFHLLRLDIEVAEGRTVALRQWQAGNDLIRTSSIRKKWAAQIHRYGTVLAVHAHLARSFIPCKIEVEGDRALLDASFEQQQTSFLQRRSVGGGALWRIHLIDCGPGASAVLDGSGEFHIHLLAAHFDLYLIVVSACLQIHGGLRSADAPGIDLSHQDDRLRIHGNFLQARYLLAGAALLILSSQVLGKEFFRRHEQREIIDGPGKPVPFVRCEDVLHRETAVAQRNHDLFSLTPVHSGIIGSLGHKQRRLDLVGGVQGRFFHQQRFALRRARVAHALIKHLANGFPIRRNRIQQRDQIRRPHDVDCCAIEIGSEGDARQGGVAAIGTADNAHPFGIGDALGNHILHTPGQIVLHFAAPLPVAGVQKLPAVTG